MQSFTSNPRAAMAKTQEELANLANEESSVIEEEMEHPICESGFYLPPAPGEMEWTRMDDVTFEEMVTTLLKSRPTSRLMSVRPSMLKYKKKVLYLEAPEVFKASFATKAMMLKGEFMRHPDMVGFEIELHNIPNAAGDKTTGTPAGSITILLADEEILGTVPVRVTCKYRRLS